MGFRFRKSKRILPGVRLNISKSGVGVRVGGKHGGVSFSPSGTRMSASIPGTGVSYSTKLGGSGKRKSSSATAQKQEKTGNTCPVPLRWWYILIAVCLLIGGIGCLFTDLTSGIFALVIFAGMASATVWKIRSEIKHLQTPEEKNTTSEI